jgi:hypothetical protein
MREAKTEPKARTRYQPDCVINNSPCTYRIRKNLRLQKKYEQNDGVITPPEPERDYKIIPTDKRYKMSGDMVMKFDL